LLSSQHLTNGVPFPHSIELFVSGSHYPKSVFFGWIGVNFLQTFWWTLNCSVSATSFSSEESELYFLGSPDHHWFRRRSSHHLDNFSCEGGQKPLQITSMINNNCFFSNWQLKGIFFCLKLERVSLMLQVESQATHFVN